MSKESYIDYPSALGLVKRINRLIEKEDRLKEAFICQNLNLWQAFQGSLFSDAKFWTKEKRLSQESASLFTLVNTILSGCALLFISLLSVLFFILSQKKVLIFSEDKVQGRERADFRLASVYEALKMERISYGEVLHTVLSRETFKNFFRRQRPVVYLETWDFLITPLIWLSRLKAENLVGQIDFYDFTEDEKRFVVFEIKKFLASRLAFRWKVWCFKTLLVLSQVKIILAIDDTRYYHEIMVAAQNVDISTVAIQHGHFTKYHTGWLKMSNLAGAVSRPERLLVWSEYWRKELLRLGTYFKPEEIVVGGSSRDVKFSFEKQEKTMILFPYEKDAPKKEVRIYINKILEESRFEVVFKVRSDQTPQEQLEEYGLLRETQRIKVVTDIKEILPHVAVTLGTYSTFLYEMVEAGIPVGVLKTSLDYGEGMVENGLAELVDSEESIARLACTSEVVLRHRRELLVGKEPKTMTETVRGIIKSHV